MAGALNEGIPRTADDLTAIEFEASRLLIGKTRSQVAQQTNVSEATVKRIEMGLPARPASRAELVDFYLMCGVRYSRVTNRVSWLAPYNEARLREAPTEWRVGRFHGERIRIAAYRLALPVEHLAGKTNVPLSTLKRMLKQRDLQAAPTLELYAVVGFLEDNGYYFKRSSQGGDKSREPRPQPEERDYHPSQLWRGALNGLKISSELERELERAFFEEELSPEEYAAWVRALGAAQRQPRRRNNHTPTQIGAREAKAARRQKAKLDEEEAVAPILEPNWLDLGEAFTAAFRKGR